MRKKLLIFGHYGLPNWGDEAILSGILSQIDTAKYSVTVVSHNPEFSVQQAKDISQMKINAILPPPFGVRSFFRGLFSLQYGIFNTKKSIQEADIVIFGGGGLFQDRPEKAIRIWNFYAKICQYYGKKICILGNSFETLANPKNYATTQKILEKVPFCSVRDEISREVLNTNFLVPDFKIPSSSDAAYFLPRNSKSGRKKGVLLAIREGEIPESKEKKILKIIREYFPHESEKNEIEVVVMQEKNAGDSRFAERHNLPLYQPENLNDLQEKIRSSKFILTSRLHGGILANISGTPFIAISMRDKIRNFFGEKFSFSLQKIFTKKGEKQFRAAIKNYRELKTPQRNFYDAQIKKLRNFFPEIF